MTKEEIINAIQEFVASANTYTAKVDMYSHLDDIANIVDKLQEQITKTIDSGEDMRNEQK